MKPPVVLAWTTILIQGGHVLEHVVQSTQVFVFGTPPGHAHGLLGGLFDLEWVHFAYNSVFLVALGALWHAHGATLRERGRGLAWAMFVAGLALQAYHEIEHLVKMIQHVVGGQTPAPGLLGNVVDLVLLHLAFNVIVYVLALPLLARAVRNQDMVSPKRSGVRVLG